MSKLRSRSGETLIEALASILIIVFSSLLLLSMSMAASKINAQATQADSAFRQELAAAEQGGGTRPGTVTLRIGGRTCHYDVYYAGDGDALSSYELRGGGT